MHDPSHIDVNHNADRVHYLDLHATKSKRNALRRSKRQWEARTSISCRTWLTYRRRSMTSLSSNPNSRAPVLSTTLSESPSATKNTLPKRIYNALYALLEVLEVRFQRRERRLQLTPPKPIPIPKPHTPARNCQQSIQISLGQDVETHLVPRPDELLAVLARRAADAEEGRAERPGRLQRRLDLLLHRVVWVRRHLTSPVRMFWASNGDGKS